jgi:hypothetical protein
MVQAFAHYAKAKQANGQFCLLILYRHNDKFFSPSCPSGARKIVVK